MTTGQTIAFSRWTLVDKVMSLLFNMVSRLVITFLPRSKPLLISWLQSPSAVILEPHQIKSATISPSICHEMMDQVPSLQSCFQLVLPAAQRFSWCQQGDNIQPWPIPFPIWNQSVVPCPVLTVASWPAYRFLKRQVRWSGIPISQNFPQFIVIHTFKSFGIVNK